MGQHDELLRRHKPLLRYDSHEVYFADAASVWTDNPTNVLRRADGKVIAAASPKPGQAKLSLGFLGPDRYANGDLVQDTDVIGNASDDYLNQARLMHSRPKYRHKIYGRPASDRHGRLWLQYWFFYFYNDFCLAGYGLHEGDWEMVQLRMKPDLSTPDCAVYAQHRHAESRDWDAVEKAEGSNGEQPVVYVARGSHASYFAEGSRWTGVWFDRADGAGEAPKTELRIVEDEQPSWVAWPGDWGDTQPSDPDDRAAQPSPAAPCRHDQWADPATLLEGPGAPAKPPPPTPPTPAISAVRTGERLSVTYGFPGEAPADAVPEKLAVTLSAPEDPLLPTMYEAPASLDGGTVVFDTQLRPELIYYVHVCAVADNGTTSASAGAVLEAVAAGPAPKPISLTAVRDAIAAIASLGALVYLTGGLVLALRLAFVNLPALGVVGQLPHGFLFSLGATEIILPALALAAIHGMLANMNALDATERPHQWRIAGRTRRARARHVFYAGVAPVFAVIPGAILALARDDDVPNRVPIAVAVAAVGSGALCYVLYRKYLEGGDDELVPVGWMRGDKPRALWRERVFVLAGLLPLAILGGLVGAFTDADYRYCWLCAAWAVSVPAALLYLFIRGWIGDRYRFRAEQPIAQIGLSLATAAVTIPALVVFWSAWQLEAAAVCAAKVPDNQSFHVRGVLVGETSDHVYVGNTDNTDGIVSIPQSRVVRTVIGGDDVANCP